MKFLDKSTEELPKKYGRLFGVIPDGVLLAGTEILA